jgi:hypothetical protein
MELIGRRFEKYSKLFPDQIINLSTEIQQTESNASNFFDNDVQEIRRIMNQNQLSINIDFTNFGKPLYLITTALYSGKERPNSKQDIIRFLLANLYICKDVLLRIIEHIRNKLIGRIAQYNNDYQNRTNNYMVKVWHEFIGCCENAIIIIMEYRFFVEKINDRLQDIKRARIIEYPDRNKIREGIYESLIKTSNARHVAMPLVRLTMELLVLEDVGINMAYELNRKIRTKKIRDIIPTRNMKIDNTFSLMAKMRLCSRDQINGLYRIYEWGSKSVHKGQMIPLSAIWYSFFFVTNELVDILGSSSRLSYSNTKKEYEELLYHEKIKVTKKGQTYDPSFSNF